MPQVHNVALGRYLQHLVKTWLKDHGDRPRRRLAEATGVSPAQLSDIIHHGAGGLGAAQKIAKLLGKDAGVLLSEAERWNEQYPQAPTTNGAALASVPSDDPYQERVAAVAFCEKFVTAEAIRAIYELPVYNAERLDRVRWAAEIAFRDLSIRGDARADGVVAPKQDAAPKVEPATPSKSAEPKRRGRKTG